MQTEEIRLKETLEQSQENLAKVSQIQAAMAKLTECVGAFANIRKVTTDFTYRPGGTEYHETQVGQLMPLVATEVDEYSANLIAQAKSSLKGSKNETLSYRLSLDENNQPVISVRKSDGNYKHWSEAITTSDLTDEGIRNASEDVLKLQQEWLRETGR